MPPALGPATDLTVSVSDIDGIELQVKNNSDFDEDYVNHRPHSSIFEREKTIYSACFGLLILFEEAISI